MAALAVTIAAAVLAIPMTDMRLGLPSGESYSSGSEQRESYDAVTDAFGEGLNGPLMVVATSTDGSPIGEATLATLATDIDDPLERLGMIADFHLGVHGYRIREYHPLRYRRRDPARKT